MNATAAREATELLACAIASIDDKEFLQKLAPAFFLAQCKSGQILYSYRLCKGHVSSDELGTDIDQLAAVGLIDEEQSGRVRMVASEFDASSCAISETRRQLLTTLTELFQFDKYALDAAATSRFFELEGFGDPSSRLAWFRQLPDGVRREAAAVESSLSA